MIEFIERKKKIKKKRKIIKIILSTGFALIKMLIIKKKKNEYLGMDKSCYQNKFARVVNRFCQDPVACK